MGYSLCNTLWGPKLVPCTVESTRFPLHDSLLTVRQTDIQSPVWMITLLLTMTLSFMCNLGERIHTPFCSSKKSQTPLRFSFLVSTSTEQKLSTDLFSFYSCLDKKLNERQKKPKTDQGRSGAFSKKQLNWIIWVTCWTKPGTKHVKGLLTLAEHDVWLFLLKTPKVWTILTFLLSIMSIKEQTNTVRLV